MVSKNNRIKKMEAVATRQSHFGIRKLTIGAASVLLGTTLWLGTDINVTHAEDENAGSGDADQAQKNETTAPQISDKTQVVVKAPDKDNQNNLKSEVAVPSAKTDVTSQNDNQNVANSVKANISATGNNQAAVTENITASSQNTKAPSVNNDGQTNVNSAAKAQVGVQAAVRNAAAKQVTQSALKQNQGKHSVTETSQSELSQTNQTKQKTNSSSAKLDVNNLNLASNNNLTGKQDLKGQDILTNLVNAKQNNDQANAVTTSSFNPREYAKTSEAALDASLISSSKNGQNNGQAASGQIKQVVIAGENKAKTADLDSNVGSQGVKPIAPDQIDSAPQVKEATDTLKANSGRAYNALKDLADKLNNDGSQTVSLSSLTGNSKDISEDDLEKMLESSLAEGDNSTSETVDGVTFSDDPKYPADGIIPNNQYVYWKFHYSDDPGQYVYIATDRDYTQSSSTNITGNNIYYYVTNDSGRVIDSGTLTKNTDVGSGNNRLTLYYFKASGIKAVGIGVNVAADSTNKITVDYGPGSFQASHTQANNEGTYVPRATDITVEYVDDTGKQIADPVTVYGLDHQYYDATEAINKSISGYTKEKNLRSDSAPVKGILDARKKGYTYVTGNADNDMFVHKVTTSDGVEDITLYAKNGDTWTPVTQSLGTPAYNGWQNVDFQNGETRAMEIPISNVVDKIIVVYKKNAATHTANLTFHDDTSNVDISTAPAENTSGDANTAISFTNAASQVSALTTGNGKYDYVGVSGDDIKGTDTNNFNTIFGSYGPKYATTDNSTQNFVVHFKHKITESTITKKVNLKVAYQNEDGSDAGVTPPDNATNQILTFTGTAKKDAVTGNYLNADGTQGDATTPVYTLTVSGGTTDEQNKGTFAEVETPEKEGYTVKSVIEDNTSVDDGSGNVKPILVNTPNSSDPDEQTVNVLVTYQKKSAPVVGNYKEITVTRTLVRNIDYKINSNKATDYDPSGLTNMDLNKLSTPHTETQTVTLEGVGVIDKTTGQLVAFDHTFDNNGNVVVTPATNGDAFVVEKDDSGKAKQGQFYWRLPNGSKFAGFDNPTADGFTSETGYDKNGKMSLVTDPSKVPEVNVTKDTEVNVYDSKGNLVSTPTVGDLLNQWNKDTVSEPFDTIKHDSNYPNILYENGIITDSHQYIFDQFQLTDANENPLDTIVTLAVDPTDSTGKVYVYFTNSNYTHTWYHDTVLPNGGSVYYGTNDDKYEKYNNGNYVLDRYNHRIFNPNHHIISVYNFGGNSGNSVSVSVDNYNDYNLKRIFGYGTQFTGDDDYSSSWGDYKPSAVSQTISFIDQDTGQPIQGYATIKNSGITGESYDFSNFKAPEIPGYELVSQPAKTGSLSDFKVGQTYTRTWMTVTGVKITEEHKILNDSGEVQTYVWINGQLYSETPFDILKNGYLKGEGNQTPDVTVQDSDGDQTTYVIQNPYVPQTTDLKYVYKKVNTSLKKNPVFVVYTPGNTVASMTVKYEDEDENDRVLQQDPISGSIGDLISYSTSNSIQNFEKQGYVLDQDNYPKTPNLKFSADNNGQTYTVLLKHKAIQVTPNTPSSDIPKNTPDDAQPQNLKVTVTRNIDYKLDNGSGNPASMSEMTGIPSTAVKQQTITFTGTTFVDAVTGHKVHAVVKGKDGQGNNVYVVDNSNTTPVKIAWSVNNNGKFDSVITPNVDGYTHSPQTISEERVVRPSESYTEPTNYVVYTPNAVQDTVNYIDDTTGKTLRTDSGSTIDTLKGEPNDAVTYITSSIIRDYEKQGYILALIQPKPFTDGQMKFGTTDQAYEVHLIHKIDTIDKDNPHGQTVTKTVTRKVYYTVDGVPATDANLHGQTKTATFNATGYYDEVTKQVVYLQKNTTIDQGKVQINNDGSVKSGTLTWKIDGGTTDSTNFIGYDAPTKTGYHVNNITVDPTADKVDNVIDAGQKDAGQVKGITVSHNSHDVTIYINLTKDPVANPQAAEITVIDEDNHTTNNQLASAQITGKAGSQISFADMSNTIQNYLSNGYVWDYVNEGTGKNDQTQTRLTAGKYEEIIFGNFDSDDNTTQNWKIYLRHGTTHVDHNRPGNGYTSDDLQKTVTTKISYVDEKGNEISGLDPISHTVRFSGEGYYDNVTKKWVKVDNNGKITGSADGLSWTYSIDNKTAQNGDSTMLNAINAQNPMGYTYAYTSGSWDSKLGVDTTNGSVAQQTVDRLTADSNIVVHFNKAQANLVITYHDDTTGTDLKTDTEKLQNVGSNISYSTQPSINNYVKQGYKLVSDVIIPSKMPANGFTGIVHLEHDTIPQKVTETAKALVHYIISGNPAQPSAPADSATQTITWTKTDTIDKVTDKTTKEGTWTSDKNSFNDVTSPTVDGYTPSQTSVSFATPIRGQDQVVTVVYTKNPAKALNADLKIYDKSDDNSLLNTFNDIGTDGNSISFSSSTPYLKSLIDRGYVIDSFTNDSNKITTATTDSNKIYDSSDSNSIIKYDNFDQTKGGSQHFILYLVHSTNPVGPDKPGAGYSKSDLQGTVTRTINYVDQDGNSLGVDPVTETVSFKGQGTVDNVTGHLVTTGSDGNVTDWSKGSIKWTHTVGNAIEDGDEYTFNPESQKPAITYDGSEYDFNHVDQKAYDNGKGAIKGYTVNHASSNFFIDVKLIIQEKKSILKILQKASLLAAKILLYIKH